MQSKHVDLRDGLSHKSLSSLVIISVGFSLDIRRHPMCPNHLIRSALIKAGILFAAIPIFGATPAIDVGTRKQLFIDTRFVQASEGITLSAHSPYQTGEQTVTPDATWEKGDTIGSYSTIVREDRPDGPLFRLWYMIESGEPTAATGFNPPFMGVAYAESTDGLHFRKPQLGLVEKGGSKENNLVIPSDPSLMRVGGGSVGFDENPNCPPAERYKSWSKIYPKPPASGMHMGHGIWASPDGLHWKFLIQPTGLRAADTQPSWFWDTRLGKYVGYSREWVNVQGEGPVRMASRVESEDMRSWSGMQIALSPDTRDFAAYPRPVVNFETFHLVKDRLVGENGRKTPDGSLMKGDDDVPIPGAPVDMYGPGVFPYREADDVYVGLVPMFYHWRFQGKSTWPDTCDVQLALSRDGIHFIRPEKRQPFLALGPGGRFDSRWIWPMVRPVRMGDELWFYYVGLNQDHSSRVDAKAKGPMSAISRAVLRLDGFVSADADYEGGWMLTPPIRFSGSKLELNVDTSAGGEVEVEVLDALGTPISGYTLADADPINANSIRTPVSWHTSTDVTRLAGRTIQLHIRMRNARLYAFQFTDPERK